MFKKHNIALILGVYTALISTTFASEQSESKGFVEDASGTVLFRNGFIQRDKKMLLRVLTIIHGCNQPWLISNQALPKEPLALV